MSDTNVSLSRQQPPGETHLVFNQPTPLEQYNAYTGDAVLQ